MLSMQPIGRVKSPYTNSKEIPKGLGVKHDAEGVLEIRQEFEPGLADLEGFSHLYVIWAFDRSEGFDLTVTPPSDNRPHGVFATRSPRRPNPIALTVVELLGREGAALRVRGVDMLDGTPILDIKPYLSSVPSERLRRGWLAEAETRAEENSQRARAERFKALHDGPGAFIIPNPWDVASARILAGLGFQALATSSAASACAIGRRDGGLTRDEALAHARLIVGATDLPVSADLEKGFGDAPEVVAETVRLAAQVGLVGCTIEDTTGNPDSPLYDFSFAVERIAAAAEAAHALPFPFMLTARTHNLLYAAPSLDETIRRLQAFEKAGAEVLFAPGLPDLAAVRAVCQALTKPFNFMAGIKGKSFAVDDLAAAGVRRISLATSLYRAAMTGFLEAAREVKDMGRFGFLDRAVATPELIQLMRI